MRATIVGNTGFIGSNLERIIGRTMSVAGFNSRNLFYLNSLITEEVTSSDYIFWCASRVTPSAAQEFPDLSQVELDEWGLFLDRLQKSRSKAKIIFLSSGGCIYDGGNPPFKEHHSHSGINAYGKLKADMENVLLASGLTYSILRVANAYGPGQLSGRGQGVVAEWARAVRNNETLPCMGSPLNRRDYIYIDDVCEAMIRSAKTEGNNLVNIGSGVATTLVELKLLFQKILKLSLKFRFVDSRQTDRTSYFLDVSKAKNEIGWEPRTTLLNGLTSVLTTHK
jgi:UDP-glucose 4-epimerase